MPSAPSNLCWHCKKLPKKASMKMVETHKKKYGFVRVIYGLCTGKANPGFYLKPEVYQPNVWVCTGKVWVSYGLRTG